MIPPRPMPGMGMSSSVSEVPVISPDGHSIRLVLHLTFLESEAQEETPIDSFVQSLQSDMRAQYQTLRGLEQSVRACQSVDHIQALKDQLLVQLMSPSSLNQDRVDHARASANVGAQVLSDDSGLVEAQPHFPSEVILSDVSPISIAPEVLRSLYVTGLSVSSRRKQHRQTTVPSPMRHQKVLFSASHDRSAQMSTILNFEITPQWGPERGGRFLGLRVDYQGAEETVRVCHIMKFLRVSSDSDRSGIKAYVQDALSNCLLDDHDGFA